MANCPEFKLEDQSLDQEELDDMVIALKEKEASEINNAGPEAQVQYIGASKMTWPMEVWCVGDRPAAEKISDQRFFLDMNVAKHAAASMGLKCFRALIQFDMEVT